MLELSERQSLVSCTITRQCKTKYLTWNNFLSGFDFADNQFCQHFGPIVFADTKAVARKKPYKKHTDHIPSYKIKTLHIALLCFIFLRKKAIKITNTIVVYFFLSISILKRFFQNLEVLQAD